MNIPFSHFNWVKTLRIFAALTLSIGFIGCYSLDLWAKQRLNYFESSFSEAMKRPVTIRRAGFSPLRGFYFDDFAVKELKTAPRPLLIKRLEAHAQLLLWPEPTIRVHKIVLRQPQISLDVHPEDLFRSQLWIRRVPYLQTKIGQILFEVKLDTVEAQDGTISLFSPSGVRQDFERVYFFAGKNWRAQQKLLFEGGVTGKPEARFQIECLIRRNTSGEMESDTRADFQHFTSAYLAPFLADRFHLPDRNLTGSLRVSMDAKGVVSVLSRLTFPEHQTPRWALWKARPYEALLKLRGRRELERVVFDDFTVRASGITVYGNGSVVWKKGREGWIANLEGTHVPAQKLPEAWVHPWHFESGSVDFALHIQGDAHHCEPDMLLKITDGRIQNRSAGISIDRASGSLRLFRERVELHQLWMFWNNVPVRLSGLAILGKDGRLAIEGQTHPGQLASLKKQNPLSASFRLAAKKRGISWSGVLRTWLETGSVTPSIWTASFREWRIRPLDKGGLDTAIRHLLVRSDGLPGAPFRGPLRIDGLQAQFRSVQSHYQLALHRGDLEGGTIAGLLQLENKDVLAGWVRLRGLQTKKLADLFGLKYPLQGTLDASVHLNGNIRRPDYTGRFRIRNGRMGTSRSLQNLSRETGIAALDPIRFERLFGRFKSSRGVLTLDRWLLEGTDMQLAADARIREGVMAGRLSARFPMRVIRASSSLAWLANFVGEKHGIDFDFRIAGKLGRPRAHWMAGTFRDKIEKRLAPWMQAEFTRQIQKRFATKTPAIVA